MSDCVEKRFQGMLHHYELGMLPDDQRLEFEVHLLDCDHCLEQVQRFQRVSRLLTGDPEVQLTIRELDDAATEASERRAMPRLKWVWSRLVPSAAAVVVFLLLVLKDWQVDIRPTNEAVAESNRLAVLQFDNLIDADDPRRFGEIAAGLLITDLSQSHYVRVLSPVQFNDLLRTAGTAEGRPIDPAVALKAARQARVRWLLHGSILRMTPEIVVTTQLIDVSDGSVSASERITGQPGEDIFAVVDRLTIALKNNLALPEDAHTEEDRSVAEVTTNSVEAFRYYMEGIELEAKFYRLEAVAAFREALEHDSTFAMVYYYLALLEDRTLIAQAARYSAGASWKEQRYISAMQARLDDDHRRPIELLEEIVERYPDEDRALQLLGQYEYELGNYRQSIGHLTALTTFDPENKVALNQLAYSYSALGNLDSAIWAINRYVELAPDEANPYDSRGDLYSVRGKIDEAIESYRAALGVKPDFAASLEKLGHMYVYKGEYDSADSVYRLLERHDDPNQRSYARYYRAYIPLRQGRMQQALAILDEGIVASKAEQNRHMRYLMHRMKALILEESARWDEALVELDQSLALYAEFRPNDRVSYLDQKARLLAQAGDFEQASQLTEQVRTDLETAELSLSKYWYMAAVTAWQQGDHETAVDFAEKYAPTLESRLGYGRRFTLARIYLDAGRLDDAVTEFEDQIRDLECSRLYWGHFSVKTHYYLGRAYEESHWYERAIAQYRTFLELWQNADEGIVEIDDARRRLTRLQSES
jgi:tetratricopeptide (TPR) repeat protein